ncbi:HIRAN domain-containing protein [Microbacterium sp. TNHR37B]|uniref:HIRAN domain-containing protein n=1 Tax=Microbacterium sp. TNHR37B TaxID=1775956 RepID=UPI0007B2390C|nr:hypothetical protein AVP41_00154 [Microbacterium sp. TNHR37B]
MWPFKRRRAASSVPVGAVDLRGLESTRVRVKGTAHYVAQELRESMGGPVYVLRREPGNPHDGWALAVWWGEQRVGYVSAAKAAALSPLLDRVGDTFVVSGMGAYTNSTRLWVDLPKVPALRAFVGSRSVGGSSTF